ncbi:hypothetical protein [Microcystis phage MaeS]|nr:hypothetical protein [Microcystis phage MaeS]
MEEIWLDIIGYEGQYQISNLGKVRSLDRIDTRGYNQKGRILRIKFTKNTGYATVSLSSGSQVVQHRVHQLVAKHFVQNPYNKRVVNHIDGDKKNNNYDNLEWNTHSENNKHAIDNGLRNSSKGEKHGKSKLTKNDVIFIRSNYDPSNEELNAQSLADKFGVKKRAIFGVILKETWKHI